MTDTEGSQTKCASLIKYNITIKYLLGSIVFRCYYIIIQITIMSILCLVLKHCKIQVRITQYSFSQLALASTKVMQRVCPLQIVYAYLAWGLHPRPPLPPGLWPWTPLGTSVPQTPCVLPTSKSWRRHWLTASVLRFLLIY